MAQPGLPAWTARRPLLALFLASVAALLLELLLIRWIGTEIRIFAYLQNSVLVVCFLGLGIGSFTSHRRISILSLAIHFTILAALLSIPFARHTLNHIGEQLGAAGDFLIWNHLGSAKGWEFLWFLAKGLAMTYLLMFLTCQCFVPLGRIIGRLLDQSARPVSAYSVNVAGSLIGIWLFVALSAIGSPPVVWVLVFVLSAIWFAGPTSRLWVATAVLFVVLIGIGYFSSYEPGALETHWSPYQKLVLRHPRGDEQTPGSYLIEVNSVGYQGIIDTRPDAASTEHVESQRRGLPPALFGIGQYDLPTLVHPDAKRVLLVGAGAGNDAAGVVRGKAEKVVAVEIDPAIVELGRRYHPERPYDQPRVQVVVDDARAYFARTNERFDVISFGLLDAHTQTALTNGRLDHFVYTRESIHKARELLAPGGVMLLSFEPQRPYIADRIARTLADEFGRDPLIFRVPRSVVGWGGVMYIAGDLEAVREQMARVPALGGFIDECIRRYPVLLGKVTPVTTDDWPYLYLKEPAIPVLFYFLAGLIVLLLWHVQRSENLAFSGPLSFPLSAFRFPFSAFRFPLLRREHLYFFALGAGFLLLEVHNVSRSAVVLGTSWLANAVIITGILIMILFANLVVNVWPALRLWPMFVLVCAACLGLYVLDMSALSALPYVWRVIAVGLLTSLPMAFSGVIFIRSFAAAAFKDQALGANLLGSVLGSVLQITSMAFGLRSLLLLVIAFYLLAAVSRVPTRVCPNPER